MSLEDRFEEWDDWAEFWDSIIQQVRDGTCSVRYASHILMTTDEEIQEAAWGEIRQ